MMKKIWIVVFLVSFGFNAWSQGNKIPEKKEFIQIKIENSLGIWRKNEVIELDWNELLKRNASFLTSSFVIENNLTGEQLPYQIIQDEDHKPVQLLVQASIAPESAITISIKKGTPDVFKLQTFGRKVPERKDDFAWENDRIAFRMYGPALEAAGEFSNGIDVWVKRTTNMVIDKWYKLDDYHVDHGEGLDYYKVGPTLGAGGIAPYSNGKLVYSKNWSDYKVITTGNLRTVFELSYSSWIFDGKEISETKRITLNAGTQLNRVSVTYKTNGLDTIPVAMGIVKRPEKGVVVMNENSGYISYWEPTNKQFGTIGIGLIVPRNQGMSIVENQLVAFGKALNNQPFTYYQGAGWDRAGEFRNEKDWESYLDEFSLKLKTPLKISINQ